MNSSINAATKLYALIGHPVGHSLSPAIQNKLIKRMGDDAVYLAFDIENDDVEKAVLSIRALSMFGVNVTAPHKQAVIPFLDTIDEKAKKFQAVNVIKNDHGRLIGFNTDVEGLFMYLRTQDVAISGKDVLILGAGGLASSLLTGIWDENPGSVTIINRTTKKAIELAERIGGNLNRHILTTQKGTPYDIVINAATAGMEAPTFVELKVTETEPGIKGDTANNVTKPATLETGAIIQVPIFVNEGDMIRVDTRTSEYMERC